MNKPWIVVGVTGDKIEVLHTGFDGEAANAVKVANRGKFEQVQVTRNGHYNSQWKGRITEPPEPKERTKRPYTKRT